MTNNKVDLYSHSSYDLVIDFFNSMTTIELIFYVLIITVLGILLNKNS